MLAKAAAGIGIELGLGSGLACGRSVRSLGEP